MKKLFLGLITAYDAFQTNRNMMKTMMGAAMMEEVIGERVVIQTHADIANQRKAELVATMDEKAMLLS